jgi:hypothetical protein
MLDPRALAIQTQEQIWFAASYKTFWAAVTVCWLCAMMLYCLWRSLNALSPSAATDRRHTIRRRLGVDDTVPPRTNRSRHLERRRWHQEDGV